MAGCKKGMTISGAEKYLTQQSIAEPDAVTEVAVAGVPEEEWLDKCAQFAQGPRRLSLTNGRSGSRAAQKVLHLEAPLHRRPDLQVAHPVLEICDD